MCGTIPEYVRGLKLIREYGTAPRALVSSRVVFELLRKGLVKHTECGMRVTANGLALIGEGK